MKEARAILRNARVSLKHALVLTKKLKGMKVEKAEKFLNDLLNQRVSINGKYYTKTTKTILNLLKSAKANALKKDMDEKKLFIKLIKADKGETLILGKTRAKFANRRGKSTHLIIILGER
ncbi:MAG: hypothetical protein B6U78_01685 [Candidatus Aenigmarchaeota archaeon ex4484_224]|nr:MAG: hypothetical protein B6U78_01685 [Candidatus Aenigmarchaeota archaeon ex4484_224]